MAYCPKCLLDIAVNAKYCQECGTTLVKTIPVEQRKLIKWSLVGVFNDLIQAEMVKTALENHNIGTLFKTDVFRSALLVQGTTSVGTLALIYVLKRNRRQARQIIKGMTGK